jgi:hypothetical protein
LALIELEVPTIKVRIAGFFRYPAKIHYAFEIRIQRWLHLCEQQEDRSTINDSIIDMDQVIEQILTAITTQSKHIQPAADIITAAAIGTDSLRAL